jgi:hypothetical protein
MCKQKRRPLPMKLRHHASAVSQAVRSILLPQSHAGNIQSENHTQNKEVLRKKRKEKERRSSKKTTHMQKGAGTSQDERVRESVRLADNRV